MDQTTVFNNAGVCFCEAGRLDVAQDMFLAALEETLLFARAPPDQQEQEQHANHHGGADENGANSNHGSTSHQQQQQQQQQRVTPRCVITAETHLANMEAILSTTTTGTSSSSSRNSEDQEEEDENYSSENTPLPPAAVHQENQQDSQVMSHEINENIENNISSNNAPPSLRGTRAAVAVAAAYLYKEPIALQANSQENNSPMPLIGAVVVFNLAVVHHLRNAASTKARQFYEISNALMEDALQVLGGGGGGDNTTNTTTTNVLEGCSDAYRCTLLQVALTNNFGVWSHENGNLQEASESLQRLIAMSAAFGPILPLQVQDGVHSNIIRHYVQSSRLVIPGSGASMAEDKTLTPAW